MTTQAPTPKTKVKATSRASHPAASKQRLFQKAQREPTPALSRAPSLKLVDESRPTPPDALRRLEQLEARVSELEAQLGAEAEADAAESDVFEASGTGDEAAPEAGVDTGAQDLGGESA